MKVEACRLNRFYRVSRPAAGARGVARFLRREVGVIHAVKDVSFDLADGGALGLIGMNGAGKSTTLKMLTGVLAPSSGWVRLDGRDPMRERRTLSKRLGFMAPLKGFLWWDLPAKDTFRLIARMYDIEQQKWESELQWLAADLDFDYQSDMPVRQLSTGNRIKAELICTLIPRPDLIVLDEPTIGLDLLAKEAIHRVLRRARKEFGATLILTSHDMRDVDALCDEVIVIDKGAAILAGSISTIHRQWDTSRLVRLDYAEPNWTKAQGDGLTLLNSDRLSATYTFDAAQLPAEAIRKILEDPCVIDIRIESLDLAEVVRRIYAGQHNRRDFL